MADKLRDTEVLNLNQVQDLNKLKDENENLKKKNAKLKSDNAKWVKHCEEWKKKVDGLKEKNEEMKRKNEDKKCIIEGLRVKHEAEKKAIVALKKSKHESENNAEVNEKLKLEFETIKTEYAKAIEEINKLAKYLSIFGKISDSWPMISVIPLKSVD